MPERGKYFWNIVRKRLETSRLSITQIADEVGSTFPEIYEYFRRDRFVGKTGFLRDLLSREVDADAEKRLAVKGRWEEVVRRYSRPLKEPIYSIALVVGVKGEVIEARLKQEGLLRESLYVKPWNNLLESKADDAFRRLERAALSTSADGDTVVRYLREVKRRGIDAPVAELVDLVVGIDEVRVHKRILKILQGLRDAKALDLIFNANYPFYTDDGVVFIAHVFDIVSDGLVPTISITGLIRLVERWLRRYEPEAASSVGRALEDFVRGGFNDGWSSESLHQPELEESAEKIDGVPYPISLNDVHQHHIRIGHILRIAEINRDGGGAIMLNTGRGSYVYIYDTQEELNEEWRGQEARFAEMDQAAREETINHFASDISGVTHQDVADAVVDFDAHWSEWRRHDVLSALDELADHSVEVGTARYGQQLQLFLNKEHLADALRRGIEMGNLPYNVARWSRNAVEAVWSNYSANRPHLRDE